MRTVLIAIGLVACIAALTGCDVWDKLTSSPKPQVVTCNCAPPIRGSRDVTVERTERFAPPPRRYARHSYRRIAHSSSYAWHRSYSERSVDIYNYSSPSQGSGAHGYATGEGYEYGYGHGGCCDHRGGQGYAEAASGVWADGYGRRHRTDQSAVRHYTYEAHQRALETPQRLDPWHGYNDDWD